MEKRWWTKETIAVVTGAQRGIGYAIARRLAGNGIQVILIDRNGEGGTAAVKALNDAGVHNVLFYQLDVQDGMAINEFANWVKQHYGKLDILVNNAGILGIEIDYDIMKAQGVDPPQKFVRQSQSLHCPTELKFLNRLIHFTVCRLIYYGEKSGNIVEGISENYEMAKACIDINYNGTKKMVEALLPLLKLSGDAGGRVVNMASRAGLLEFFPSETLRQELNDLDNLTENTVDKFIKNFLMDFQQGLLKTNGWPLRRSAYHVSKAAIIAYTRILAREHADMYVNCVHPGYVKTDMTFNTGVMSIDEGAEGPVMLALLPPGSSSGQYFNKKETAGIYFLHK